MGKTKNTRLSIDKKRGEFFSEADIDCIIQEAGGLPVSPVLLGEIITPRRKWLKQRLESAASGCLWYVQERIDREKRREAEDAQLKKFTDNLKEAMQLLAKQGVEEVDDIKLYDVLCTRINERVPYNEEAQARIKSFLPKLKPVPIPNSNPFAGSEEPPTDYDYQPERIMGHIHDCLAMLCSCLEDRYVAPIPIGFDEDYNREQRAKKNDKVFDFYIKELCRIWEEVFQDTVGTSYADVNIKSGKKEAVGPLIRFIQACCKPLHIEKPNDAVRATVRKLQKNDRKEDNVREVVAERRYEKTLRALALQLPGE